MSLVIPPLRATTSRLKNHNNHGSSTSRPPSRPSSSRQSLRPPTSRPSSFIACHEEKIRSRAARESFSTLWSNQSAQFFGGEASQDVISERERRKADITRRRRTVHCSVDAQDMLEGQVIGLGLDDGLLPEKTTENAITVEEKKVVSSRNKHRGI
ncbi:hypothetical protein KEM54_001276, partial [Ascosphaera aggregata]